MPTQASPSTGGYLAPLFAGTPEPPETVCAVCPASLWYEAGHSFCFCTVMKMTTWPRPAGPITRCDGQSAAVAKLAAELRQKRI